MIQVTIIIEAMSVALLNNEAPPPCAQYPKIPPSLQFFNSIQLKAGWQDSIFQSLQTNSSPASLISLLHRSQRASYSAMFCSAFHCIFQRILVQMQCMTGDGGVGSELSSRAVWAFLGCLSRLASNYWAAKI